MSGDGRAPPLLECRAECVAERPVSVVAKVLRLDEIEVRPLARVRGRGGLGMDRRRGSREPEPGEVAQRAKACDGGGDLFGFVGIRGRGRGGGRGDGGVQDALHALRRGRVKAGETVAIFGVGGLGMSAIQLAKAMGATDVYAVDIQQDKLELASEYNAIPIDASRCDAVEEIRKLKQQPGKNIGVTGSPTLVQSLLQSDLLDELTLMIHPVVVGHGKRLFNDERALKRLTLADSKITPSGVALLTYVPRKF